MDLCAQAYYYGEAREREKESVGGVIMSEKIRLLSFIRTGDIMVTQHNLSYLPEKEDFLGWFVGKYPSHIKCRLPKPAHGGLVVVPSEVIYDEIMNWTRSKPHVKVRERHFNRCGAAVSSSPGKDIKTLFGVEAPDAGVQVWGLPEYVEIDKRTGGYTWPHYGGRRIAIFLRHVSNWKWTATPRKLRERQTLAATALSYTGYGYDIMQMAGVAILALKGRLDLANPLDPVTKMNCTEVAARAYTESGYDLAVNHPQIAGKNILWWIFTPDWIKRELMRTAPVRKIHPTNLTWVAGLCQSLALKEVRHDDSTIF